MASVREVARKTGLSATTVSRALNAHPDVSASTRARVIAEARKCGYPEIEEGVAEEIAGTSVAYVVLGDSRLWEYDWLLMDGIIEGLRESKLDLTIVDMQRCKADDETYSEFFRRRGVRGVIMRTYNHFHALFEEILAEGVPSVVVAERFAGRPDVSYVCCDSSLETTGAVNHLLELGHRRIALVLHRRPDSDHLDRHRGYLAALEASGAEVDESLVVKVIANLNGGKTALNRLMSLQSPPTAIVFTDPLTGIGGLLRTQEVGLRVPADLSIVGFDDASQRFQYYPRLTAVCQDTRELGMEAGVWLARKIQSSAIEPLQVTLHATLEINQTTGLPPNRLVRLQPNGDVIE